MIGATRASLHKNSSQKLEAKQFGMFDATGQSTNDARDQSEQRHGHLPRQNSLR